MAAKNTTFMFEAIQFPVALHKVSDTGDVRLDTAGPHGEKCKTVKFEPSSAQVLTPKGQGMKGIAYDGGEYHAIPEDALLGVKPVGTDDELKGIFDKATGVFAEIPRDKLADITDETKLEGIEVVGFVPIKEVPFERAKSAYFLSAQSGGRGTAKPLALFHKVMTKKKVAAVAKLTLTSRQHLAVIYPLNGAMIVNLLTYATDFAKVKDATEALEGVRFSEDKADEASAVEMASGLIEAHLYDASLIDAQKDELVEKKQRLVDDAIAGRELTKTQRDEPALVPPDGLMDALRKSVAKGGKKASPRATSSEEGKAPTPA